MLITIANLAAQGGLDPVAAVQTAAQTAQNAQQGGSNFGAVGMVIVLTVASLLPAIVLSCTCFVRFVVVLGFVRTGMGTPAAPPNQVLVGLALFMAIFTSAPVAIDMYEAGGRDYFAGKLDESQAIESASPPLRTFLLERTQESDLELFYEFSADPRPATAADVPLRIAIPAFIVSELRTAFEIGLTILLPFLVIDLICAAVLTSLGMVMVPPAVVALPIKLLVFVMIDGWHLVVQSLLRGATA